MKVKGKRNVNEKNLSLLFNATDRTEPRHNVRVNSTLASATDNGHVQNNGKNQQQHTPSASTRRPRDISGNKKAFAATRKFPWSSDVSPEL